MVTHHPFYPSQPSSPVAIFACRSQQNLCISFLNKIHSTYSSEGTTKSIHQSLSSALLLQNLHPSLFHRNIDTPPFRSPSLLSLLPFSPLSLAYSPSSPFFSSPRFDMLHTSTIPNQSSTSRGCQFGLTNLAYKHDTKSQSRFPIGMMYKRIWYERTQ